MLALVAMRFGRPVPRESLAEQLWSDSDLDKATYNLRRALTDLRRVLGDGNVALVSKNPNLRVDSNLCWTDLVLFDQALQHPEQVATLEQALGLYVGPLLEDCDEDWVYAPRRQREAQCLLGLELLAESYAAQQHYPKAIGFLRRALAIEPIHESAVRLLMRLLAATGNIAEIHQVYKALYIELANRLLKPSPETVALYQELTRWRSSETVTVVNDQHRSPLVTHAPGGAMPLNSPYYISRTPDQAFFQAISRRDSIALVKGPRQSGKSSLLARGLQLAHDSNYLVAVTDIATLPSSARQDLGTFLRTLASHIADALDEDLADWDELLSPTVALERWVRRRLRARPDRHLFWALDGIDDLFHQPYRDEFFALFRSWHTKRAFDTDGPWTRLTVALTYSTEAQRFITDPNQSPFNVGTRIFLDDLTTDEQAEFYERHDNPLRTESERARFRALVGGHPYLTHSGLYALATGATDLPELERASSTSRPTPFRDHLMRLREDLIATPTHRAGLRLVMQGDGQKLSEEHFYQLCSAGILVGESPDTARFRCGLYGALVLRLCQELGT